MRIPVDIRLHVYESVFAGKPAEVHVDYAQEYTVRGCSVKVAKRYWTQAPSLLLTAKQVYNEAIKIYFSETIFSTQRYAWLPWAQKLKAVPWAHLRSFHIDIRDVTKAPEERSHVYDCWGQSSAEADKTLADKRADCERQLVEKGVPLRVGALKLVHYDCDCPQWTTGYLRSD